MHNFFYIYNDVILASEYYKFLLSVSSCSLAFSRKFIYPNFISPEVFKKRTSMQNGMLQFCNTLLIWNFILHLFYIISKNYKFPQLFFCKKLSFLSKGQSKKLWCKRMGVSSLSFSHSLSQETTPHSNGHGVPNELFF